MITVDDNFLKCSGSDRLGIHTREEFALRVLGQAHRWNVSYKQGTLIGLFAKNTWLSFAYYPSDDHQVCFVFYGRGFWFDMLRGSWEVEQDKLRALGIKCA